MIFWKQKEAKTPERTEPVAPTPAAPTEIGNKLLSIDIYNKGSGIALHVPETHIDRKALILSCVYRERFFADFESLAKKLSEEDAVICIARAADLQKVGDTAPFVHALDKMLEEKKAMDGREYQ